MGRRNHIGLLTASIAIVIGVAAQAPIAAWTPESQLSISRQATRLAPPDFARQIYKHEAQYRRGVLALFHDRDGRLHQKNDDGSGRLDDVIANEVQRAINAIRLHRPFSDIVYRVGVVSHYMSDANNPLNTSAADRL